MYLLMAKISEADLKLQKEVQSILWSEAALTNEYGHPDIDKIEYNYGNYDPSMDDNVTERGIFFTPIGLAQDFNIFTSKRGHILDVYSSNPKKLNQRVNI